MKETEMADNETYGGVLGEPDGTEVTDEKYVCAFAPGCDKEYRKGTKVSTINEHIESHGPAAEE